MYTFILSPGYCKKKNFGDVIHPVLVVTHWRLQMYQCMLFSCILCQAKQYNSSASVVCSHFKMHRQTPCSAFPDKVCQHGAHKSLADGTLTPPSIPSRHDYIAAAWNAVNIYMAAVSRIFQC